MFRHRFHAPLAITPPVDPVDGFLFSIDQRLLTFGSNRKRAVSSRPVLPAKRRDEWAAVLPATSKPQHSPKFFKIDKNDIRWKQANEATTFVYWRYETVSTTQLTKMLAVISQNARMNISHWLRREYEEQEKA